MNKCNLCGRTKRLISSECGDVCEECAEVYNDSWDCELGWN